MARLATLRTGKRLLYANFTGEVTSDIELCDILVNLLLNPIRSGLFQTANDPGGGALKALPPYDLENYCVNLYHFIHVHFTRCFRHVPIGIF